MGGVPTPHVLSCFFKSRENVPDRERLSGFAAGKAAKRQEFNLDCTILRLRYADLRFAKPRKFPKGNGFILFASTKRTKSSPEGCDPLDSEGRFKTLSIMFFVIFPAFVSKPVYGATRF